MCAERFLENLGLQAEEERKKILAAAAGEAERILASAQEAAETAARQVLDEARRRSAVLRARIFNDSRFEAEKLRLAARHRVVDDIIRQVEERIANLGEGAELEEILTRLRRECVPIDGGTLESSEEDLRGVTLRSGDGRFIERNTLRVRLERARPLLVQEINRRLFHEGAPAERDEHRGR